MEPVCQGLLSAKVGLDKSPVPADREPVFGPGTLPFGPTFLRSLCFCFGAWPRFLFLPPFFPIKFGGLRETTHFWALCFDPHSLVF